MPNLNLINRSVPEEIAHLDRAAVGRTGEAATLTVRPAGRTVADTCAHYGWTRTFTYQALAAGLLKARKAGRRTIIDTESSDRLFNSLPEFRASTAAA
jgi:hypothetical protein